MHLQTNNPFPGGSSRSGCSTSITSTTIVDNQSSDYGLINKHVHDLSNDQKYFFLTKPFVPDFQVF